MSATGTNDHAEATSTDLAHDRTLMAVHRTLMAWTRTAVSLVGVGFSIPKLLDAVAAAEGAVRRPVPGTGIGLVLIAIGTLSLVAGTADSVFLLRRLNPGRRARDTLSPALLMSIAVIFVSGYAFIDVLLHASG
jgi:putative membrane protein